MVSKPPLTQRHGWFGTRGAAALAWVLAGPLGGCSAPVASALDDADAARVVVALDRVHLASTMESDPGAEGKFRVIVPDGDVSRALSVLRDESLPRPHAAGMLEAVGNEGLVPSPFAEHARYVAGLAGELERSLLGVEGVLVARVHLNVPVPSREAPGPSTASVLLEYRGEASPVPEASVQRLVAGGVSGLTADNVAVVAVARARTVPATTLEMGRVGPIAVARTSARALQLGLAILVSVIALLAATTLLLYRRLASVERRRADVGSGNGDARPT